MLPIVQPAAFSFFQMPASLRHVAASCGLVDRAAVAGPAAPDRALNAIANHPKVEWLLQWMRTANMKSVAPVRGHLLAARQGAAL